MCMSQVGLQQHYISIYTSLALSASLKNHTTVSTLRAQAKFCGFAPYIQSHIKCLVLLPITKLHLLCGFAPYIQSHIKCLAVLPDIKLHLFIASNCSWYSVKSLCNCKFEPMFGNIVCKSSLFFIPCKKKKTKKTQISNLMYTVHFWNNFHQVKVKRLES